MSDPKTTLEPDYYDRRILLCMSERGGWTPGEIARQMGRDNVRKHGQIIRYQLLRLEQMGWAGRLDGKARAGRVGPHDQGRGGTECQTHLTVR